MFISYLSGHRQASSGPVVWQTTLNPSAEKGLLAVCNVDGTFDVGICSELVSQSLRFVLSSETMTPYETG